MIFIGDIASPNVYTSECFKRVLSENRNILSGKRLICNFEGLIYNESNLKSNEPVLYNHPSIINVLNQKQKPIFCLANNHVLDLPEQFEQTTRLLKAEEILYCGAGRSRKEAEEAAIFNDSNHTIALFNVCWDFLLYNHKNPRSGIYVAELKEKKLIERIRQFKRSSPDSLVIVYIHWSLDLEILPFPMFRKFSRDLIDVGTNVVAGTHSHCIQGGEFYRNGYIIYSLGNFYIPHNQFINGKLVYPEFASIELAFEWEPSTNNAVCHWFKYQHSNGEHQLIHLSSENFADSEMLGQYTAYRNMTDKEYLSYFKKNRRKKFLIPVYRNYKRRLLNMFLTFLLRLRAGFARFLAKHGFRKWLN